MSEIPNIDELLSDREPDQVPPREPNKPAKLTNQQLTELIASNQFALSEQGRAIEVLNQSVQFLAKQLQGVAQSPGPYSNQAPAHTSGMGDMLQVMQGFISLQSTLKQSMFQDMQMMQAMVGMGGGEEKEDFFESALAPVLQKWAESKISAPQNPAPSEPIPTPTMGTLGQSFPQPEMKVGPDA